MKVLLPILAKIGELAPARALKSFVRALGRLDAIVIAACLTVAAVLIGETQAAEAPRKVAVVSFGLFGEQDVFQNEATGAAKIVASRFGGNPVVVQFNTKKGGVATIESLDTTLQSTAEKLNRDRDLLFLILTSHGAWNHGLLVVAGPVRQVLPPWALGAMLDRTGIRHKVIVISACYSGSFIPRLADPDVMVVTAADADHPSFGCQDGAQWTYFGDAFFNVALRRADTLRGAFEEARMLVKERELREGFNPSNPQLAGGQSVEPLLVAHRR
jgi:Peptidase C13 family